MGTKIIAGFPGTGKTYFKNHTDKNVLDSDSSKFSWLDDGTRDPKFPENYMIHILNNSQFRSNTDIILVSTHLAVREALINYDIPFTLVYPSKVDKDIYIQRFIDRGSPPAFVDFLSKNWYNFIDELESQQDCEHIVLKRNQYLSDVIEGRW